jgi:hypothetical protein
MRFRTVAQESTHTRLCQLDSNLYRPTDSFTKLNCWLL